MPTHTEGQGNGLRWQVDNHEDRLRKLEDQNIAVLAERVNRLSTLVSWLIATFATFIFTIMGAIIVFLVTHGGAG